MRIQVNLNDDMISAIDDYAKMMGVSRSSLCAIWIGQGKMGFDKGFSIAEDYAKKELENELKK